MNTGWSDKVFTGLKALAALAACTVLYAGMRQEALAQQLGTPRAAAITASDFPVMPPTLRAHVLLELQREYALSGDAAARATARDCYDALAAQSDTPRGMARRPAAEVPPGRHR